MKNSKNSFRGITPIVFAILLFIALSGCTADGKSFGSPINTQKGRMIDMQDLIANLPAYEGKNVIVEGKTGQICQASGCWVMLIDGSNQLFVQFYNFTVRPSIGSKVRVQGVIRSQNKVPFLAAEGLEILR